MGRITYVALEYENLFLLIVIVYSSVKVEPTFGMFEQIVSECLHGVMVLDSLESSHPISVVVRHPDEINELFDHISYSKGLFIVGWCGMVGFFVCINVHSLSFQGRPLSAC